MTDAILLVGFMGSGKTEVGRWLSKELQWDFVDLDQVIAEQAGCTIPDIFKREGESGFRQRERDCLMQVFPPRECVVSCGGGIVTHPENMRCLLDYPGTVCLTVSPEEVFRRIGQDPNRPLLQGEDPEGRVRQLMAERAPLFSQFPIQVSTDGFRPSEVAARVLSELRKPRA
jgi:shikimate kinase